ncbi:ubiquitin thioesterase otulin isoform X2 [Esox lucius]|uniref:ubiquitin thioesterase otulin isoform X2 n=1 Tax=Esox lucius TaxID=8010 RepID=UPI001476E943|nr:ubiquitin thioesterase otulin isoform X2 [Esox lucius]
MRPRRKHSEDPNSNRAVETKVKASRKAAVLDTDRGVKKTKVEEVLVSESARVATNQKSNPSSGDDNQPKVQVDRRKKDAVGSLHGATLVMAKPIHETPSMARTMEDEPHNLYDPEANIEGYSDEDLYRGEDEIEKDKKKKDTKSGTQFLVPSAGDGVSVEDAVDLLTYSESEWKGNTTKSTLIRKGYTKVSERFQGLRRVRGDNYCALRATLFQILTLSKQVSTRLKNNHITSLLANEDMIGRWKFPFESSTKNTTADTVAQLKVYLELLRDRWQAAVEARSAEEREELCQQVFQGDEEYSLLEALKFLMLQTAVELHLLMEESAASVPEFCWLLFARDSSSCPGTFLKNHLRHVGFSGGLEQVEMFLLGYSLEHTIQVYRLYKSDTQEFVTYYPDDHRKDWPCVSLVTEDDRHYNVPVA